MEPLNDGQPLGPAIMSERRWSISRGSKFKVSGGGGGGGRRGEGDEPLVLYKSGEGAQ